MILSAMLLLWIKCVTIIVCNMPTSNEGLVTDTITFVVIVSTADRLLSFLKQKCDVCNAL